MNNNTKQTVLVVAIIVLIAVVIGGLSYYTNSVELNSHRGDYLTGYKWGTAVISIQNGTWTATIIGPGLTFQSNTNNLTEVTQWAMNESKEFNP